MRRASVGILFCLVSTLFAVHAFGSPLLNLATDREWTAAHRGGNLQPVVQWNPSLESQYPGMQASLHQADILVTTSGPGLVLTWQPADSLVVRPRPEGIASWQYRYTTAQNLSDTVVSFHAVPDSNITAIGFGLIDSSGRIKSWTWTVGATGLPPRVQQRFVVVPTSGGPAIPAAATSHETGGFDPASVVALAFSQRAALSSASATGSPITVAPTDMSAAVTPSGFPAEAQRSCMWKTLQAQWAYATTDAVASTRQAGLSFSVATGGPSGFAGAAILTINPLSVPFSPSSLGLGGGDDIDALSYGVDRIKDLVIAHRPVDFRFSVDDRSIGERSPESEVYRQGVARGREAHGDEFRVLPPLPPGGTNELVLDETFHIGLRVCDDIDALTAQDPHSVDQDGNGIPDLPVYFSLTADSPWLRSSFPHPGGPATIFVTRQGYPPTVYATAADLGLLEDDDLDAMCLDEDGDGIWEPDYDLLVFSLDRNSRTLQLYNWTAADLLVAGGGLPSVMKYSGCSGLGLAFEDNLNALKAVP